MGDQFGTGPYGLDLVLAQVAERKGISEAGPDLIMLAAATYLLEERARRPEVREAIVLASG